VGLAALLGSCEETTPLDPIDAAALELMQARHLQDLDEVRSHLYSHDPGRFSTVYLKVAFPVDRRGVRDEWMWVQAVHWGPEQIEGILVSEPRHRTDLGPGSVVMFGPERVADYWELDQDGVERGNALQQVLEGSVRTP